MASFAEYETAARMRDLIKTLVREEMEATRPVYKYATVASINRVTRRATVVFPDSPDPVPVQMGAMQPRSVGQTVRIDGIVGDRYIAEVLGPGHLDDAEIELGIGGFVKSSNYSAGNSGFILEDDGSAEFNDVTMRGDVTADSFKTSGSSRIEMGAYPSGGSGVGVMYFYTSNVPVARMYGTSGGGILITATDSSGAGIMPYINLDNDDIALIGNQGIFLQGGGTLSLSTTGNIQLLCDGTTIIDNVPSVRPSSLPAYAGAGWNRGSSLIIDGGSEVVSNTDQYIPFHQTFNGVITVVACFGDNVNNFLGSGSQVLVPDDATQSGFTVRGIPAGIARINWIALGW